MTFFRTNNKYVPVWCGFACLGWGKLTLTPSSVFSQEVSLWFEEDPVSEVVFRFDVGHVHHHLHLPVRLRRH